MIKAFKHKQTGRYLACISKKHREVETVKSPEYAMTWDFTLGYRKSNYVRFVEQHKDELKDFMEVTF